MKCHFAPHVNLFVCLSYAVFDGRKQVTKRVDTDEGHWAGWNWRTDGDIMVNGAFFVPSGDGLSDTYAKASSYEPRSAALVTQLTMYAGVFGGPRYVPYKFAYSLLYTKHANFSFFSYNTSNLGGYIFSLI